MANKTVLLFQLLTNDANSHSLRSLSLHQANPPRADHLEITTVFIGNLLSSILFLFVLHFSFMQITLHRKNINFLNIKVLS